MTTRSTFSAVAPFLTAAAIIGTAMMAARAVTMSPKEHARQPKPQVQVRTTPTTPPPYTVVARKPVLEEHDSYPCSECHDASMATDDHERELKEEHSDLVLRHGGGRFWCLTCHERDNRDALHGLKGQTIDYDAQVDLCAQCHFKQARDFTFGAHGKRVGTWNGDRVFAACTTCHDAHDPSIKPRKPYRAERLRPGLLASPRDPEPLIHEPIPDPSAKEPADDQQ